MEAEEDVTLQPNGELNLEKMAQYVQNLSLKSFYDQIYFRAEQRLPITRPLLSWLIHRGAQSLLMRNHEKEAGLKTNYDFIRKR